MRAPNTLAVSWSPDWGCAGWGWGDSARKRTSELGTSYTGGGREAGAGMLLAQNKEEEMGVIVAEQVFGSLRSPDKAPTPFLVKVQPYHHLGGP